MLEERVPALGLGGLGDGLVLGVKARPAFEFVLCSTEGLVGGGLGSGVGEHPRQHLSGRSRVVGVIVAGLGVRVVDGVDVETICFAPSGGGDIEDFSGRVGRDESVGRPDGATLGAMESSTCSAT